LAGYQLCSEAHTCEEADDTNEEPEELSSQQHEHETD
jgi:hypothetical protein